MRTRLTAIVDVGANPIEGDPPYVEMLHAGLCTLTGFEPQPEALAALEREKGPTRDIPAGRHRRWRHAHAERRCRKGHDEPARTR